MDGKATSGHFTKLKALDWIEKWQLRKSESVDPSYAVMNISIAANKTYTNHIHRRENNIYI